MGCDATPHPAESPVARSSAGGDRPAILVADDDPHIRRLVAEILHDEGYPVLTAADGQQALVLIRTRAPALVLLDLQMPLLSGWEVLDRLRAEGIHVPVVFMTAAYRARAEAQRHEADGFLAKPFEVDELLAVVARYARPPADG